MKKAIIKQIIRLSEGCPYSCPFCFNGKKGFKELTIPEIDQNKVELYDDAFLSKKNYLDPKIYPEHWTRKEIKQFFTYDCREHSQIIRHEIDVNVK